MTTHPIRIAPSILAADFGRLAEEVAAVTRAGADWIHVDVMDGHFVPNLTIGPMVVKAVRKATHLPLDVHLMIEEPDHYIDAFAEAGSDHITVHVEAGPHLHRMIHQVREAGGRLKRPITVGASLNPGTSLSSLDMVLAEVDLVLVMSVNPGFGGQSFIEASIVKIRELSSKIKKLGLQTEIEVDGGVTLENAGRISRAGANVFVAGNTVFTSPDYKKTIASLRRTAMVRRKS
jgi:ribulose-phosphate 3-epimerase